MLNMDIVSKATTYQEKDYYEYRQVLHSIYDKDVWYGDLVGSVLAFRDQNKYVETISIDIKNYRIYIILKDGTNNNDHMKIINGIINVIKDFISVSSTQVDENKKILIDKYINTNWPICDYYNIGNYEIQFVL